MANKQVSEIIGAPVDPSREHHPDVQVYNEAGIKRIVGGIPCESSLEAMTVALLTRMGIPVKRGKTVELGGSGLWYTSDLVTPHMVVDPHIVDSNTESRLRKEMQMAAYVRGTHTPILVVYPNGMLGMILWSHDAVRYRDGLRLVIGRCQHCGRMMIVPHRGDGSVECPDCGASGLGAARLLYDGDGHSISAIKSKIHPGRMSWMEFWCHYGDLERPLVFGEMISDGEEGIEYVRESRYDYRG